METPGIVLIDPKYPHNLGAAIRACSCFEAKSLVWTGEELIPRNTSGFRVRNV